MCGIAGIVTRDGSPPAEDLLRRMAERIAHRGPDGEGVWTSPGAGFAHRRLAIIDLSPSGSQPMHDASGGLTITFNGEIYNYRELRREIGASWRSESDTEVILEGYKKWGDDVTTKLRGMFAFALWDADRRRLLLARDRIGKKPLFHATTVAGDLVFASEIKALVPAVPLVPDLSAIRLFLGLQYVPSPKTGFLGVEHLEPGCLAVWENGVFSVRRYHEWNVGTVERPAAETDRMICDLLDDAVKVRQLAADVPVGAFLSGGVDSAAVVAFASKHVPGLETFTMGFASAAFDERAEAKAISEHFGTTHHEFEAKPDDLVALADDLVAHYDAPYADSSALPLWLLARETSKSINVVLTGDGGDETFGGYRRYVAYERALRLAGVPGAAGAIRLVSKLKRDPRFARMADVVASRSYGEMFCGSYFASRDVADLCVPDFLERTSASDAVAFVAERMCGSSDLDAALRFDLTSYLPDDLNVKMDRATMRFGLEARAPFLDQNVVAFALSLPLNEKVNRGKTKVALKRAVRGIVPDDALDRPKRGFQVPLAEWFRGPLLDSLRERCLLGPLLGIAKRDAVERLIEENRRGADHGNRLWMLYALSSWLTRYGT